MAKVSLKTTAASNIDLGSLIVDIEVNEVYIVSVSISENVYIGGVKYTATGTRDRYLWVYIDDPRAEWKSTTVSPMPPGVEIYDTHENAVHIPRFG